MQRKRRLEQFLTFEIREHEGLLGAAGQFSNQNSKPSFFDGLQKLVFYKLHPTAQYRVYSVKIHRLKPLVQSI